MKPDRISLPYRPGVGIMLLNKKGDKVFVGQRIDQGSNVETWQMPQGGIDEGEDSVKAAFRELKEEIGTDKAHILKQSKQWFYYEIPDEFIMKLWGGKYRGQKQMWYLMRLDGEDDLININTPNPEFKQWKWVDPIELPDLIVSFKKDLYQQILKEFIILLT